MRLDYYNCNPLKSVKKMSKNCLFLTPERGKHIGFYLCLTVELKGQILFKSKVISNL